MEPVHALLHTLCKSHGQPITACAADAKRADEAERSIREHAECFSAEEHRFAIDARAKMPCGHFEVYAVSPDGKSVFCSLCQLADANAEIERLRSGISAALFESTGPMGDEWRQEHVREVAMRPMPGDIHQGEQHEISVNRALTEIADLLASTPAAKEPR